MPKTITYFIGERSESKRWLMRVQRDDTVMNLCDRRARQAEAVMNLCHRRALRAETVVNICDRRAQRAETMVKICALWCLFANDK